MAWLYNPIKRTIIIFLNSLIIYQKLKNEPGSLPGPGFDQIDLE